MTDTKPLLSIVVPLYNEAAGLKNFHASLLEQLKKLKLYDFEIIYCNDGSTDKTLTILAQTAQDNEQVRIISLSRNFGKEIATAAGLHHALGEAVITLDADGQHPVELLPEFIARWQGGARVVIGLRTGNQHEGIVKRLGSKLFYGLFSKLTRMQLMPSATDYRLIDQAINDDFKRLNEHNRITRGLIDWLGYRREYVPFHAKPRVDGEAPYSFKKLFRLAIDSAISLSSSPLYITAYIGVFVLLVSIMLGLVMIIDAVLGDPFGWDATGGSYVLVLILFLVGCLMMSQGIMGLYLSHIHSETQNRPLYIIDKSRSKRL